MFETLLSKTFFVLAIQLLITYLSTSATLIICRKMYDGGSNLIIGTLKEDGYLDLDVDRSKLKGPMTILLILYFIVFFASLFAVKANLLVLAMLLFVVFSIIIGVMIALSLLSVDERLGGKVVGLTALIVLATSLIGMYSGVDFAFLGKFLFFALLGLIFFGVLRIFVSMKRSTHRIYSFFAVGIFTLYLIFDFNMLMKAEEVSNTWQTAFLFAMNIYLDIINIIIHLIDALSN